MAVACIVAPMATIAVAAEFKPTDTACNHMLSTLTLQVGRTRLTETGMISMFSTLKYEGGTTELTKAAHSRTFSTLKFPAGKRLEGITSSVAGSQVTEAVAKAIGSEKVGVRLSPYSWEFNDCKEPDVDSTIALNVHLLKELNKLNLAYVHIVSARAEGKHIFLESGTLLVHMLGHQSLCWQTSLRIQTRILRFLDVEMCVLALAIFLGDLNPIRFLPDALPVMCVWRCRAGNLGSRGALNEGLRVTSKCKLFLQVPAMPKTRTWRSRPSSRSGLHSRGP